MNRHLKQPKDFTKLSVIVKGRKGVVRNLGNGSDVEIYLRQNEAMERDKVFKMVIGGESAYVHYDEIESVIRAA